MASRVRVLVAVALVAGTLGIAASSSAHAATRCDPLRYNAKSNSLPLLSSGALLIEYHTTVTWCTAPNNSVKARVYSPQRTRGSLVSALGLLAGWKFDRVLYEKRAYYTYKGVPNGGYYVKTHFNFLKCTGIVPVCSNRTGWLETYAHYDRSSQVRRGWG